MNLLDQLSEPNIFIPDDVRREAIKIKEEMLLSKLEKIKIKDIDVLFEEDEPHINILTKKGWFAIKCDKGDVVIEVTNDKKVPGGYRFERLSYSQWPPAMVEDYLPTDLYIDQYDLRRDEIEAFCLNNKDKWEKL